MKLFKCTQCDQPVYFENTYCEKCAASLGFVAETLQLVPLINEPDGSFTTFGDNQTHYHYCANYSYGVCNWVVRVNNYSPYCIACDLNRIIPNLSMNDYLQRWKTIENAKHRLVYSLLRMKLPLISKIKDPFKGLAFDFVADDQTKKEEKIFTGHDDGLITINIAEADDIEREMARRSMFELYRTLLGHFRHEIGHYYWDRLIFDGNRLTDFRKVFGDEQQDYAEALNEHYKQGPPLNWSQHYISAYATAHPWEDWAETWAHYMHIVDTLETAYSFRLTIDPLVAASFHKLNADINTDPYKTENFERLMELWLPLTFAMNSLNRSMGLRDSYPFIITREVQEKLKFIHDICYSFE